MISYNHPKWQYLLKLLLTFGRCYTTLDGSDYFMVLNCLPLRAKIRQNHTDFNTIVQIVELAEYNKQNGLQGFAFVGCGVLVSA